ncbi:MerR family transcriptional regulator [Nocardia sp. A7]|uniref:DNA polymerase III subunit beta family protein n=1 Tax=Nocardia sp. A7 TaxID=2789274 RepID=UPI003979E95B
MPDTELITIGAFARVSGLSASALRFYADAGVLAPAVVDEATGYRYYAPEQSAPARLLRHLRAVDMPLPAVTTLLTESDPTRAIALLDHHLADLDRHQDTIRAAATAARGALLAMRGSELAGGGRNDQGSVRLDGRGDTRSPLAAVRNAEPVHGADRAPSTSAVDRGELWVGGPVLAAAIDQVATATVADSDLAVLDTILFETDGQQLTLTATDRCRLATRTVRPTRVSAARWDATIDAADLRAAVSWLRRQHVIAIRPERDRIEFCRATTDSPDHAKAGGGPTAQPTARRDETRRSCRRSTHEFPDYRAMLAALPAVRTRVVLSRAALLYAMEHADSPMVVLQANPTGAVSMIASSSWSEHVPAAGIAETDDSVAQEISVADSAEYRAPVSGEAPILRATVTGPTMTIHFAVTTLYPAVATAVGPDVMLDLIAPDQPALIRSADDGDLLTLAMPCRPAR